MTGINRLLLIALCFILLSMNSSCNKSDDKISIPNMGILVPTEGNTWIFANQIPNDFDNALWYSTNQNLRTYFWISGTGIIDIGIKAKVNNGKSTIKATFGDNSKELEITNKEFKDIYIGSYTVNSPGYFYLEISGVNKQSQVYAEITYVLLGGEATSSGVKYANEEYFYWGRRGPSVHLSYKIPNEASDVEWFYNEVTIPAGNDVVGSYFMANGFSQGYFGFQVNSLTERRILFSVWSPYQTDDPSQIPAEYRVVLLKKGAQTIINEFGNEGSGGQSYLVYNWKSDNTYRFLLKVHPAQGETNKTDYTAYFYAPELSEWTLIASWRRPFTSTYAKGLHSFLENFNTASGPLTRQGYYSNQWVCDTRNQWFELVNATFTADATARDEARLDYAGGAEDNKFFLKNCGFFNSNTQIDSYLTRKPCGVAPIIDFLQLP